MGREERGIGPSEAGYPASDLYVISRFCCVCIYYYIYEHHIFSFIVRYL